MKKLLPLLPLVGLVGCASLSSYQEARVLDKGKVRASIGITGYSDDLKREFIADSTGMDNKLIEVGVRVGIWDNLDFGVKYTVPGAAVGDVKYQLLGRDSASQFQLSAGLKGGYASLDGEDSKGETVSGIPVIDLVVPVYATYAPTSWLSVTAEPQFCYRISDNKFYYPGGAIAGANIDLRLGKTAGLIGEFGYHRHLDKDYTLMNYGVMFYTPLELSDLFSGALKSFL